MEPYHNRDTRFRCRPATFDEAAYAGNHRGHVASIRQGHHSSSSASVDHMYTATAPSRGTKGSSSLSTKQGHTLEKHNNTGMWHLGKQQQQQKRSVHEQKHPSYVDASRNLQRHQPHGNPSASGMAIPSSFQLGTTSSEGRKNLGKSEDEPIVLDVSDDEDDEVVEVWTNNDDFAEQQTNFREQSTNLLRAPTFSRRDNTSQSMASANGASRQIFVRQHNPNVNFLPSSPCVWSSNSHLHGGGNLTQTTATSFSPTHAPSRVSVARGLHNNPQDPPGTHNASDDEVVVLDDSADRKPTATASLPPPLARRRLLLGNGQDDPVLSAARRSPSSVAGYHIDEAASRKRVHGMFSFDEEEDADVAAAKMDLEMHGKMMASLTNYSTANNATGRKRAMSLPPNARAQRIAKANKSAATLDDCVGVRRDAQRKQELPSFFKMFKDDDEYGEELRRDDGDRKLPARKCSYSQSHVGDSDDDDDDETSIEGSLPAQNHGDEEESDEVSVYVLDDQEDVPYSLRQYVRFWKLFEEEQGRKFQQIERTNSVRASNKNDGQMYGRISPMAMDKIFRRMGIQKDSLFVDIGHGIGNTCVQAAFTYGCKARGIEIDEGRNNLATAVLHHFEEASKDPAIVDVNTNFVPGRVTFIRGDFREEKERGFVTTADFAYCNNFNGVFSGVRRGKPGEKTLDDYLALLFASMKEGAVLVTLHPIEGSLHHLPLSQSKKVRRQLRLCESESDSCSFYDVETFELGEQRYVGSWSENGGCNRQTMAYMYTRVKQSAGGNGAAVFMCNNPACQNAKDGVTMEVVAEGNDTVAFCGLCRGANSRTCRVRKPAK